MNPGPPQRVLSQDLGVEDAYKARVMALTGVGNWTGVDAFKNYFQSYHSRACRAKVAVIDFLNGLGQVHILENPCHRDSGRQQLLEWLTEPKQPRHRLFAVECPCPKIVSLLGGHLQIDPIFWVDHFDNLSWFREENTPQEDPRLPLPSARRKQSHLHLRTIQSREKTRSDGDSQISFLLDDGSTGVVRKAGLFKPIRETLNSVVLTRHRFTAWFKEYDQTESIQSNITERGWRGLVAFDPDFLPENGEGCQESKFINFVPRTGTDDEPVDGPPRNSPFRAYLYYLSISGGIYEPPSVTENDCFLMLNPAYRLIAAEWRLTNAYFEREVVEIEHFIEISGTTKGNTLLEQVEDLERHLARLFISRRRCKRYKEWVLDAHKQCINRGQRIWPRGESDGEAAAESKILEEDFTAVLSGLESTLNRIEKCLDLVPILVSILIGKIGLQENKSISRLTFLAAVLAFLFTPLSTVAQLLAMPGKFSIDGGERRYVVFIVSTCFTLLLLPLTYLQNNISIAAWKVVNYFRQLW